MRKLTAGAVLVAGVLGGAAATAVVSPGLAATVTGSTPDAVTDRVDAIKDALSGLVDDGTLTQPQADEVAETLGDSDLRFRSHDGHPHGLLGLHGLRLDRSTVADILGVTVAELRTARADGKTLAEVAEAEGISRAELVEDLVAAIEKKVAAAVDAGDLSQERADAITDRLQERVEGWVDRERGPGDWGGRGRHGFGHHGGWDRDGDRADRPDTPAPSASASPSSRT